MSSRQDHQPPEQSIEQPSAKLEPDNNVEKDDNLIKFFIEDVHSITASSAEELVEFNDEWE